MRRLRHVRARWPDHVIPPGEPEWLLYEFDEQADKVLRTVDVFPDGTRQRNSIEIEERDGRSCPSLIGDSIKVSFSGVQFEELAQDAFEAAWIGAEDTPFWNVR